MQLDEGLILLVCAVEKDHVGCEAHGEKKPRSDDGRGDEGDNVLGADGFLVELRLDVEHELPIGRGAAIRNLTGRKLLVPIVSVQQHAQCSRPWIDAEQGRVSKLVLVKHERLPDGRVAMEAADLHCKLHGPSEQLYDPADVWFSSGSSTGSGS